MSLAVDVVRQFRRLRVLVVGDAMLDSYLEGTATRLCREGPVPVVRKTSEEHVPGGAANTAANLRALGAEVALLAVIGADVPGRLLRDALRAVGVQDQWLVEESDGGTLHKLRILANGQYVVRFDDGRAACRDAAAVHRILDNLDAAFAWCDLVVVSDYGYGVASEQVIERLRLLRAVRPCVLAVDAKDLRRFQHAGATVVTPNHHEALAAVDGTAPYAEPLMVAEVEQVGRQLLALIDAECAAVTMASEGVCIVERQAPAVHIPAHPVAHANDVGAGDSFTAALALALGAGADCTIAGRIATDAAAIAVTKQRTAVVEHQELIQRVSLREHAAGTETLDDGSSPRLPTLVAILDQARVGPDGRRRTLVFTNGVFDILHAGHVEFLRRAKALGDLLVVGVNSDRSTRLLKGKQRPINGERDRLALVSALEPVDFALLFDEETPVGLIHAIRPDIHVKGGDYADRSLPEAEAVAAVRGQIEIVPLVGDHSTSGMIDRILHLASVPKPLTVGELSGEVGR